MTLVASFSVCGWPVVVGDIIISSLRQGTETEPFNIPTCGNVNARATLKTDRLVSALVQKVTILTPRLALAWAGSALCARAVFREILERSSTPEFHHVAEVLNVWRNERGVDLYVTGIYLGDRRDNDSVVARFAWDSDNGWETRRQAFPDYGDCYAGGTGAESVFNLLGNSTADLPVQTPALESAICHALAHLGRLAGDQIRLGFGIDHFYGGAFEVATLLGGQLQKIGDVTYHFWEARSAPNSQLTIIFHTSLRIAYFEDYLVIRKLEYGGNIQNMAGADELYVIRPVHRMVSEIEKTRLESLVPRPALNARFNVFYVHFPEVLDESGAYVSVHKSKTSGHSEMIRFEEENGELQFEVNSAVLERIQNALKKRAC